MRNRRGVGISSHQSQIERTLQPFHLLPLIIGRVTIVDLRISSILAEVNVLYMQIGGRYDSKSHHTGRARSDY